MEKKLREITELEFHKGLVDIIKNYECEINKIIETMRDVSLYKDYGFNIKYYFDSKRNTYKYIPFEKPKIGFR